MEHLKIPASASSPLVDFDAKAGVLRLSGESYPENSFEFYRPILEWVETLLAGGRRPVTLELHLIYLNTSSIKCLMDLLDELERAHRSGWDVTVNWLYEPENDRALELAEEFREDFTLPFFVTPAEG